MSSIKTSRQRAKKLFIRVVAYVYLVNIAFKSLSGSLATTQAALGVFPNSVED
ncbi:MAG: hypothetical protein O2951_05675 [Bacteroidetes bacterium]|nr:hypothetical protein [Bacteroidota bacterium]